MIRAELSDGTTAIVRPIRWEDDVSLKKGLARLSPEGQVYRFLQYRGEFTEQELYYLTHCDTVDHYALILAIADESGAEVDQIGVARYVRDKEDPALAEVAIVLIDQWQRRGGGSLLAQCLVHEAWRHGIRRWQAFCHVENSAIQKLLDTLGHKLQEKRLGHGTIELLYELHPPGSERN